MPVAPHVWKPRVQGNVLGDPTSSCGHLPHFKEMKQPVPLCCSCGNAGMGRKERNSVGAGSWGMWVRCFGEDGGLCEGGDLALLEKPLSPAAGAGTGQGQQVRGLVRSAESGTVCSEPGGSSVCQLRVRRTLAWAGGPQLCPPLSSPLRPQICRHRREPLCSQEKGPWGHSGNPVSILTCGSQLLNRLCLADCDTGKRTRLGTPLRWHLAASCPSGQCSVQAQCGREAGASSSTTEKPLINGKHDRGLKA